MNLARSRELGISRQLEPVLRGVTHVARTPRAGRRRRSRLEPPDEAGEGAAAGSCAQPAGADAAPGSTGAGDAGTSDEEACESDTAQEGAGPSSDAGAGEAASGGVNLCAAAGPQGCAPPRCGSSGALTAQEERGAVGGAGSGAPSADESCLSRPASVASLERAAGAAAASSSGGAPAVFQGSALDVANWMGQLHEVLRDVPLHKLRMPGTHDSGAYALSRRHMAPSKLPRWLLRINRRAWWLTRPFSGLVARWGEAQRLDVAGQLLAGARYLDLRIVNVRGAFHVAHGMLGVACSVVLDQVSAFLDAHPGEVVVADCNHFHHFAGRADHEAFIALVTARLARHLARRELRAADNTVTLGALVAAGTRCVLLYGGCDFMGVAAAAAAARCWPRTLREILSPWPRAASMHELRGRLGALDAASSRAPGFFVLQGVVTPNGRLIRRGLLRRPSSLRQVAATVTPEVVRLVTCGTLGARCIILLDHIDLADVAQLLAAAYAPHLLSAQGGGSANGVEAATAELAADDAALSDSDVGDAEALEDSELDSGGWMDGAEAWAETADAPLLEQLSLLLRETHFAPGAVAGPSAEAQADDAAEGAAGAA